MSLHNLVTLYRFYTPFLDIEKEREKLFKIIPKIKHLLISEGFEITETRKNKYLYSHICIGTLEKDIFFDFRYLQRIKKQSYFLPLFQMDVFLHIHYTCNKKKRRNTVYFLNNLFECFSGLTSREYVIELDNSIYYTQGFLRKKIFPIHYFQDLNKLHVLFLKEDGGEKIENFLQNFRYKPFVLTLENSEYYHQIHGIFLYFIYLVYSLFILVITSQNKNKGLEKIENQNYSLEYGDHIYITKKRLKNVTRLTKGQFLIYNKKLSYFFCLFEKH